VLLVSTEVNVKVPVALAAWNGKAAEEFMDIVEVVFAATCCTQELKDALLGRL